jgi:Tfp pilus assembly protein PilV
MYLSSTLTRYPRYFAGSSFRCHDPRTGVMTPERGSCSRVARLKGVQHGVADGLGPSPVVLDNSQCRENGVAAFSARRAPPKQQDRLAECRGVRVWSARMPYLAAVSRVLCDVLRGSLGVSAADGCRTCCKCHRAAPASRSGSSPCPRSEAGDCSIRHSPSVWMSEGNSYVSILRLAATRDGGP